MKSRTLACPSRCCIQNVASRRQRRGQKVTVGPGSRESKAGHETKIRVDFCVRSGGLCGLGKEGANRKRVEVGVANCVWFPGDKKERERASWTGIKRL